MISKQRGIIDPWTLGFLIGLTGLTITQPWDRENDEISGSSAEQTKSTLSSNVLHPKLSTFSKNTNGNLK